MKIVGIHPGHLATAALVEHGEVVGLLSQEKLDNRKNSVAFPAEALCVLMAEVGWHVEDVDAVAVAGNVVDLPACYDSLLEPERPSRIDTPAVRLARRLDRSKIGRLFPFLFTPLKRHRRVMLARQGLNYLNNELEQLGLADTSRYFVDHHLCHARAAFHALNPKDERNPALVFTLDGGGDGLCASINRVNSNGSWDLLATTSDRHSIGLVYSLTTRFLGMRILNDEYKVMGLAPYAGKEYLKVYERLFSGWVALNPENPMQFHCRDDSATFYDYLALKAPGERFDHIAAAVQHLTEEVVCAWVAAVVKATGIRRIFTGGGVFMNVKLNKQIQQMEEVESCCFMPSCGDESTALGAAYDVAASIGDDCKPLESLNLGLSYADEVIESFLQNRASVERFKITCPDSINDTIVKLLVAGEVVAKFSGRNEWGARSLGNRAILAHPGRMESFYEINDVIKCRDFWMPFAPSVIEERAGDYLDGYCSDDIGARFMITAFDATPLAVEHLRAAMHRGDHSIRAQVVTSSDNLNYHALISEFEARTGIGAVLNTSFNMHGYPLVATPEQALFTLENSGLKHLAIGPFLVSKR